MVRTAIVILALLKAVPRPELMDHSCSSLPQCSYRADLVAPQGLLPKGICQVVPSQFVRQHCGTIAMTQCAAFHVFLKQHHSP